MAIDIRKNEAPIRESRLGSIIAYDGTLAGLRAAKGCSECSPRKRCFSQSSMCNNTCAVGQVFGIADAAVVLHGPAGCASLAMGGYLNDLLSEATGTIPRDHAAFTCTNMKEADTVFGAVEKLKDTIVRTYERYRPRAIFVASSCVSGVIGEDLEGIIDDLREIVPVPVAPVHCEGFKTHIWASGFDAAFHAILKYIVHPPQRRTNRVNVINFAGGTSWNSRQEVTSLLAALGAEPTFLLSTSTIAELERISEAAATISTCGTLSTYLGNGLEQLYGVPFIHSLQPHGIAGYEDMVRQLAAVVGKEKEAEAYLAHERDKYLPQIDDFARRLKGRRAMIAMGPSFAQNYARILTELGLEVEHVAAWHLDDRYDDGQLPPALRHQFEHSRKDYPFSVNHLQNHEFINILKRLNPDVFVTRHPAGMVVWSMKLGIPAYNVRDEYTAFGYVGTLRFAKALHYTIANRSFTDNLARHVRLPYTPWWYEQPATSFFSD
jgi:nitrogenase molybdenum-iron protein alpha chain